MTFVPIKPALKALWILYLLCGSVLCSALDREAFSISKYDLTLQIEPEQHRLGARGKITLRNDTSTPQKIAVLQISSSLDWRAIRADGKTLQFVTQPYTSDIDHTGSLSEAIVTLPQEVAPRATIDLDIAYEGVIVLDATRLTRIGAPEDTAKNTDWDQIGPDFMAVRGAGYVAWYPIATDVANLSEGESLFEVLARWKQREAGSQMRLRLSGISWSQFNGTLPQIFLGGLTCMPGTYEGGVLDAECLAQKERLSSPSLLIAAYQILEKPGIEVHYLKGHEAAATAFAEAAGKAIPVIKDWFGSPRERAKVADLSDRNGAPFENGAFLLTPLAADPQAAALTAAHQLTHASFVSFRPWIEEGLAHFAQVLYLEQDKGRQAALDYMGTHRSALNAVEAPSSAPGSEDEANHSLINTVNEELYR